MNPLQESFAITHTNTRKTREREIPCTQLRVGDDLLGEGVLCMASREDPY
jgi:hypothetical protein